MAAIYVVMLAGVAHNLNHSAPISQAFAKSTIPFILIGILLIPVFRFLKLDIIIFSLSILALLIYLIQFNATGIFQFSYDIISHLQYIAYIAYNLSLPSPAEASNQNPPLYHMLAGFILRLASFELKNPWEAVRYLSLLLFMGFQLLGLLTLRNNLKNLDYYLAAAMLLLWPIGITMGARISNDILVLFLFSAVLYYATKWQQLNNLNYLAAALFFCAAAILTKGTGLIFLAAIGFMIILALYRKELAVRGLFSKRLTYAYIGLAAAAALNFGRILYYNSKGGETPLLLNKRPHAEAYDLASPNHVYDYLAINFIDLVKHPFTNSRLDPLREFFWTYFLKSLLYGEWAWKGQALASLLNFSLILMLFYLGATLGYRLLKHNPLDREERLYGITILFLIGGLMLSRIMVGWACQADARYVYGLIIPLVIIFFKSVNYFDKMGKEKLALLGRIISCLFIFFSLIFIARQFI